MKNLYFIILPALLLLCACQGDTEALVMTQELGMLTWYGPGTNARFVNDDGVEYTVVNNVSLSQKTDSAFRVLLAYTTLEDNPTECHFESLRYVPILADSTLNTAKCDTLSNVDAVWVKGGFINLTLTFMHDNLHNPLLHTFGYRVKSNTENSDGTRTAVISLFYRHNDAAHENRMYYSLQYTFSIRPEDLNLRSGDKIIIDAEWKNSTDGFLKDRFTRQI